MHIGKGRGCAVRARYVLSALVVAVATGVFCVGVLSRLAMSLLARQNPQAHGRISDDGFEMGVVTLDGSVNLAVVGVAVGIVGWLTYLSRRLGNLPPLPAPVRIEPVGALGWLLTLSPEPMTASNRHGRRP